MEKRMARDKFYEARMAGYIAAYNIARKDGVDALEKELRMRNILKVGTAVPQNIIKENFEELSKNLYNNTMTAVAWTLHTVFGFGKKRILEFKKSFDKTVQATYDLDYLGEHYVKMEDFAKELNSEYDLGIDIIRVAVCQDIMDEDRKDYRMCKIDRVLQELRENGFKDAAGFIEKKLY